MPGSSAKTKWYSQFLYRKRIKVTGRQSKAHSPSAMTMLCAHNRALCVCPPEEGEGGDSSRGGVGNNARC